MNIGELAKAMKSKHGIEVKERNSEELRKCIYLVVYATLLMKVSCTQLSHSSGQLLLQTAALTDSTA